MSWEDLVNIFEVFLPQLLLYPNPTDPLNGEAAHLQINDPEKYKSRVKEYVQKFAKDEDDCEEEDDDDDEEDDDDDDDDEMSDDDEEEEEDEWERTL